MGQVKPVKTESFLFKIKTAILLVFLSSLASSASTKIIFKIFPERYVNPDLVFLLTKSNLYIEYFADGLIFVALAIFLFFYAKKHLNRLPFFVSTVSIMYIFQSFFKILTPMMRPTGSDLPSHGLFRTYLQQPGMFPSGHIGLVATLYFLIDGGENRNLKTLFLAFLILETVTMVISRGHYSIDAVGGILLAYFVVNETKKLTRLSQN